MISSTLYIRVVPQDKDRGFMLLAGFDPKIVQATCSQYTTLNGITRENFDAAVERMRANFGSKEVKDVTAPAIQKKLKKIFGEV